MSGESGSHLIIGSDSKPYVVKFLENPQHRLVPANEWLACHLASSLGLTVPRVAIIDVLEDFVSNNPDLTMTLHDGSNRLHSAGHQFGSEFVGGLFPGVTVDFLPRSRLQHVINRQEFIGALVLDLWVCNADHRQAVFVTTLGSKQSRAHFIDYGHCFGRNRWSLNFPKLRPLYRDDKVYEGVMGLISFEPWLAKLQGIDDNQLWGWFATMPTEWYSDGPISPEALIHALNRRRHEMPELIASLVRARPYAFPSWKD